MSVHIDAGSHSSPVSDPLGTPIVVLTTHSRFRGHAPLSYPPKVRSGRLYRATARRRII